MGKNQKQRKQRVLCKWMIAFLETFLDREAAAAFKVSVDVKNKKCVRPRNGIVILIHAMKKS